MHRMQSFDFSCRCDVRHKRKVPGCQSAKVPECEAPAGGRRSHPGTLAPLDAGTLLHLLRARQEDTNHNVESLGMNKRVFLIALLALAFVPIFLFSLQPPQSPQSHSDLNTGDIAWMLTASSMVLFMTPGLAFFYGGMVSPKNVISTMLQCFIALGVVSVVWIVVGFSIAFGNSIGGLVGNPLTFLFLNGVGEAPDARLSPTIPLLLFALFQLKFAIITPALISGAFAERIRFGSYLVFVGLFSLFIYAPLAHWTWHPDGFLRQWGILDFAGGTVVHMSAGFAALAGATVLGRRHSHLAGHLQIPAHIPFVILGTGMLWFGWFGFNAGSALAANPSAVQAFATTNTASAAAMMAWVFFEWLRGVKPSAMGACIGAVVGLVAITPAAGYVSVAASIVIGVVASGASSIAVHWKSKSTIDDTLDVFPCHGVGGAVGMVMTAIFAKDGGLITGSETLLLKHLAGLVFVGAFTFLGSWALYKLTDLFTPLRVEERHEQLGLDLSQHGETLDVLGSRRDSTQEIDIFQHLSRAAND
jgi:ammonium transporter, Amt family